MFFLEEMQFYTCWGKCFKLKKQTLGARESVRLLRQPQVQEECTRIGDQCSGSAAKNFRANLFPVAWNVRRSSYNQLLEQEKRRRWHGRILTVTSARVASTVAAAAARAVVTCVRSSNPAECACERNLSLLVGQTFDSASLRQRTLLAPPLLLGEGPRSSTSDRRTALLINFSQCYNRAN